MDFYCHRVFRTLYWFTSIFADCFTPHSTVTDSLTVWLRVWCIFWTVYWSPWNRKIFPSILLIAFFSSFFTSFFSGATSWTSICRNWRACNCRFRPNQCTTFRNFFTWTMCFILKTIPRFCRATSFRSRIFINFLFRNIATLLDTTTLYGISVRENKKSSKGLLQTLELYYRVKVLSTL